MFQAIFHHVFLRGMEDVAQSSNETGLYSVEFEPQGSFEIASLRYWKSDYLVKIELCRYSLASCPYHNQLLVIARLLSFLSTAPQIVCISGCTSDVLQAIEDSKLLEKGIEYPLRYQAISLPKMMLKRKGSVFGRIDMHTQLKFLLASWPTTLMSPGWSAPLS